MVLNKNTLWNITGGAIPAVAAIISIPVLIKVLGFELFAVVSLVISLNIFFYVYDFGVGRAMTFFFPKNGNQCPIESGELINSGLLVAIFFSVLISSGLYFGAPYFAKSWLKIDPGLVTSTINALKIAILGILPSVISSAFRGVLEGLKKFKEANIGKIFSGTTIFLAPSSVVLFGSSDLETISFSIVVTRYLALGLFSFFVARNFKILSNNFNLVRAIQIYKYSVWAAISGFISTMFVYGDRFVVSHYLNPQSLSIYISSQDILIRFLLIPWAMASVLMPVLSADSLSKSELVNLYYNHNKKVRNFAFLIGVFLIIGVHLFLQYWGEGRFSISARTIVFMQIAGVFFCAISQLPLIYIYAKGRPHFICFIYLFEATLYLLIAPTIFQYYEVTGASAVWAGRLILEYFLLDFYAKRLMK